MKGKSIKQAECQRHDCKYAPRDYQRVRGTCNYILITGHKRGCPVWDCTKYEKGEYIRIKFGL